MKKILIGAGTLAIAIIPVATVVSCGSTPAPDKTETAEQKALRLKKEHQQEVTKKIDEAKTYLSSLNGDSNQKSHTASELANITKTDALSRVFGITSNDKFDGIEIDNVIATADEVHGTLNVSFDLKMESQIRKFSKTLTGYHIKTETELSRDYIHSLFLKKGTHVTGDGIDEANMILVLTSKSTVYFPDWGNDRSNNYIYDFPDGQEPTFTSMRDIQRVYNSLGINLDNDPRLKGYSIDSMRYYRMTPRNIYLTVGLSKGAYSEKVYFAVSGWLR